MLSSLKKSLHEAILCTPAYVLYEITKSFQIIEYLDSEMRLFFLVSVSSIRINRQTHAQTQTVNQVLLLPITASVWLVKKKNPEAS